MGKHGLREVVTTCFDCPDRKACLQTALATGKGIAFRSEIIDRAAARGLVGRLRRWSEKKALNRLMKQIEGRENEH